MNVFVDASVLIHDFMYRHPEVAAQRNVVPSQAEALAAYRAKVHQQLADLAASRSAVHTSSAVLWRLAALLGEWYVPPQMVRIEMQYLLSNYHVHELGCQELEQVITTLGTTPATGIEEAGWQLLGDKLQIKTLLSCLAHNPEEWVGWVVLKP